MADKKLNEVTKVTDMAYVPVIMADGSIGQIAKADLASVVAEQIKPLKLMPQLSNADLNYVRDFGFYSFGVSGTTNYAIDETSLLLVYGYSTTRIVQVQITALGKICTRFYSGAWTQWVVNE